MKEAIVHPLPSITTEIHEVPIPRPGPDDVIIKVEVAGSNVKDWLHITARNISVNSGDDVAGRVHSFGENVLASGEFQIGDRVAAFHPMLTPGGAYAEYSVAPQSTVLKIPAGISFEEAATIPLVSTTAALTMYLWQSLPPPWSPRPASSPPLPFIIYGASSALGAFSAKFAKASNTHPIIAIGGGSKEYTTSLLDKTRGDTWIDYRQDVESMKSAVKEALGDNTAFHAVDCISDKGTWILVAQMLTSGGRVSVFNGSNTYDDVEIPSDVTITYTYVGSAHSGVYLPKMPKQPKPDEVENAPEFTYVLFRYMSHMLLNGTFEGHPYEVIPHGLNGVATGLQRLKNGEARGKKFVYRISDTE